MMFSKYKEDVRSISFTFEDQNISFIAKGFNAQNHGRLIVNY